MKQIKKTKITSIAEENFAAKEMLHQIIEDKVLETYYWLKRAYDTVPDDPQIREQLTEISADLLKMRQNISDALTQPTE